MDFASPNVHSEMCSCFKNPDLGYCYSLQRSRDDKLDVPALQLRREEGLPVF